MANPNYPIIRATDYVFREQFFSDAELEANGGVISGNPVISNGVAAFDGTDDTVTYPQGDAPNFDNKPEIILICSFRTSDVAQAGNNYFIALPEAGGLNGVDMRITNTTITFDLVTHADNSITITTTVAADTWYRLGLTYDGTTLRCYKNGVEVGSDTVVAGSGIKHASGELHLATLSAGQSKTICDLGDDVVIGTRGYTAQEMLDDYNKTAFAYVNKDIAEWQMADKVGASSPFTTTDLVNGLDLTLGDGAGTGEPTKVSGRNEYTFSGSDYMEASGSPFANANATAMSVSAWINVQREDFDGVFATIADTGSASTSVNDGFFMVVDDRGGGSGTNGVLVSVHCLTNDTARTAASIDGVINNGLNFITMAYSDDNDLCIFVNGKDVLDTRTGTGSGDFVPNSTANFTVGALAATLGSKFTGGIRPIRCHDFALTLTQHKDLYNKGPKYIGNLL